MPRMQARGAAPGGDSSRGPRRGHDALPRSVSCLLTSHSIASSSRSKPLRCGDGGACSVAASTACRLPSAVSASTAHVRGGGCFGGGGGGGGGGGCGGSVSMGEATEPDARAETRARARRTQQIRAVATRTALCTFCTCFLMPKRCCEQAFHLPDVNHPGVPCSAACILTGRRRHGCGGGGGVRSLPASPICEPTLRVWSCEVLELTSLKPA